MAERKTIAIIVAEDDDDVRAFYTELFLPFFLPGARVHSCPNGEEALKKVQEETMVDLLLTDFRMPVMDGLELAREARKNNKNSPGLKILMVSGTPPPLAVAQEAGVDVVLVKPVRDLAGEIKKMLDLCPV